MRAERRQLCGCSRHADSKALHWSRCENAIRRGSAISNAAVTTRPSTPDPRAPSPSHSLAPSLPHSLTPLLSLSHSLALSLSLSHASSFTPSLPHSHTPSLPHSLLTPSFLTLPPSHSHPPSPPCRPPLTPRRPISLPARLSTFFFSRLLRHRSHYYHHSTFSCKTSPPLSSSPVVRAPIYI